MRGFLLDTNTCIYAMKARPAVVRAMRARSPEEIFVASMSLAELLFGVVKSRHPARNRTALEAFIEPLGVLDFDARAAESYAHARLHLQAVGTPIGERGLIIAATALANELVVVTHNTREFQRVPGLPIEDWT